MSAVSASSTSETTTTPTGGARRLSQTKSDVRRLLSSQVSKPQSEPAQSPSFALLMGAKPKSNTLSEMQNELERLRALVKEEASERAALLEAKKQSEKKLSDSLAKGAGSVVSDQTSFFLLLLICDLCAALEAKVHIVSEQETTIQEQEALIAELKQERERFIALVAQQSELEAQLQARRQSTNKALDEVNVLRSAIEQQSNRAASLEAQVSDTNANIVTLKQTNSELSDALADLRDIEDDYHNCRTKLARAEQEIARLLSEVNV